MYCRLAKPWPNLVFNTEVTKWMKKRKYLKINIDESLNWEEKYVTVKNELKVGISSLRKLKDILPQRKLEQVHKALF